jgi:hypothetical protein
MTVATMRWRMDRDEIKRLYEWIQTRVTVDEEADGIAILFNEPDPDDFADAGFDPELVDLTLESDWWEEMVVDIIETPDYAEPGVPPGQVLEYARDVVVEYVRKRLFP